MSQDMADTEADTCRKLVIPKLHAAGWAGDHSGWRWLGLGARVMQSRNVARLQCECC